MISGKSINFKGTGYKLGDFLIISMDEALLITHIFASSQNDIATIKTESYDINFIPNLRAFQLRERRRIHNVNIISDFSIVPRNTHKVSNQYYIFNKTY